MELLATYNARGTLISSEFKILFEINEEVKAQSGKYLIDIRNSLIVTLENKKNVIGRHVSKIQDDNAITTLKQTFDDNTILCLIPSEIYRVKRDFKKNIIKLYLNENKLIFKVKVDDEIEDITIGTLHHPNLSIRTYEKFKDVVNLAIVDYSDFINFTEKFTMLNDSQIETICNDLFKCQMSDVDIRLTKQLIPGINLKREIGLVVDISNVITNGENKMCNFYIIQKRSLVDNFHIYKMIL